MSRIEEAITDYWGQRCPDFNAGCATCQAWAELDALKASQWQDISTAPDSEHERVLTFTPSMVNPVNVQIADGTWWRDRTAKGSKGQPTHWMPLPSPPEVKP